MKRAPLRLRRNLFLFTLLLTLLAPIGGAGCFGPSYNVPESAADALATGTKKEAEADQTLEGGKKTEAKRIYTDAAGYYGAVAGKFAGTETGVTALLKQAEILDKDVEDDQTALQTYKNILRQYPPSAFPERFKQAQAEHDRLVGEIDSANSKSPWYKALDAIVVGLGDNPRYSFVLALFVLALGITLATWPLRYKQYKMSKEMMRFQPEVQKLQRKYKEDPMLMAEKMREFQREHGYNPMAGCLPALLQIPFTWGMFYVISLYQHHFSQATFLWINPEMGALSQSWPAFLAGSIARNLSEHDLPLLILYTVSMFLQMKMSPAPADPQQAEQQRIMAMTMPTVFFFIMLQGRWPSAFVLYWFLSNLLGMLQSWIINRSLPTPPPLVINSDDEDGSGDNGSGGEPARRKQSAGPVPAAGASVSASSAGSSSRPLAANPRLVSPKNKKRR